MSQLVPCSSCGRHVRLTDSTCPFCETSLDMTARSERYAPRRKAVQSGIKRAAMFALGAGMAAACGSDAEEPEPSPDASVQPVYGAPVSDTTSSGVSSDSTTEEDSTSEPTQPLYGAPVITDTSDTGGATQPVYGAPITDVTSSELTDAGTPGSMDASAPDADVGDANVTSGVEPDAGVTSDGAGDGGGIGWIDTDDTGPTVQPLYGAPVLN